jgi:hypothetical protein
VGKRSRKEIKVQRRRPGGCPAGVSPAAPRATQQRISMENRKQFRLSVLESEILITIDHIGWYAYLWFPIVYREVLNFGSNASDEQVHVAFGSLIRKGALVMSQENCRESPEWRLAPGVLEEAKETMSLGTDLRTPYGFSEPHG